MTDRAPAPREHVENIVHHSHAYTIRVEGSMDGAASRDPVGYGSYDQSWENNLAVVVENVGATVIHNPWVVVNGRRQWRSVAEILDEILTDEMTEAEQARTIWEFARRHRYHFTTADDEVKDTVKMLNVYGYTLCWDEAYTVSNLWQAAGLRIRRGVPHGHCTTEVFFDGEYHLLDSDEHLLYLRRDNRTIASEEDLAHDHDLVKRGHAYGILSPEDDQRSEQAASLFVHSGPRGGRRPMLARHCMDLDLRPGEALIWEWADRGLYHGRGKRPPRLSNGRMRYVPVLNADHARWCEQSENLDGEDGSLAPTDPQCESTVTYRLAAPYVCVGGKVRLSPGWQAEISFDSDSWAPVADGDLTPHFPAEGPARYACILRLRATGVPLEELCMETDLQMAPLSLPALESGENSVHYTDGTEGQRQVRVTHTWLERNDVRRPQSPTLPRHPEPGGAADSSRLTFVWDPVAGGTDYEFRLSEHRDMRHALSPVFEKLISRTATAGRPEWRMPHGGLLNPGQSYFWQVRARNEAGLWGPWGPVWRFTAEGPGMPLDLKLEPDYDKRGIVLSWTPNGVGSPADHYEIYGSDERGFTAHREEFDRYEGRETGAVRQPANMIATTTSTSCRVVGEDVAAGAGNLSFYRVVAVDGRGRCSGPSEYAEAPRPFVYTLPKPRAPVGQEYQYQVRSLISGGDLQSVSEGPHRYHAAFRDVDTLRFLLDEGPGFIALDERTGLLTATPQQAHLGFHTVTLRVLNNHGAADVQGFDLLVVDS